MKRQGQPSSSAFIETADKLTSNLFMAIEHDHELGVDQMFYVYLFSLYVYVSLKHLFSSSIVAG